MVWIHVPCLFCFQIVWCTLYVHTNCLQLFMNFSHRACISENLKNNNCKIPVTNWRLHLNNVHLKFLLQKIDCFSSSMTGDIVLLGIYFLRIHSVPLMVLYKLSYITITISQSPISFTAGIMQLVQKLRQKVTPHKNNFCKFTLILWTNFKKRLAPIGTVFHVWFPRLGCPRNVTCLKMH